MYWADVCVSRRRCWTIREVKEEMVGTDAKVVVYFAEHQKGLGLNKINLRAITQDYGVNTNFWIGKPVELFRDKTQFQGQRPRGVMSAISSGLVWWRL